MLYASSPDHQRIFTTKARIANTASCPVSCCESEQPKFLTNTRILCIPPLCRWLQGKAVVSTMQAGQEGEMVSFYGRVHPCSTGKEATVPGQPVSSACLHCTPPRLPDHTAPHTLTCCAHRHCPGRQYHPEETGGKAGTRRSS